MSRIYRDLGTVAMDLKGDYDPTAYYEKLNVVNHNDSTYMAKEPVHGENPSTSTKWQLIGGGLTREDIAHKAYFFDTVASMKAANLVAGDYVITEGYYSASDGGGAQYKIVSTQSVSDYQEELNNGFYATLIINDVLNVKQIGAYGDDNHDDTLKLQRCLDYSTDHNYMKIYIPNGTYIVSDTLILSTNYYHMNIEGENTKTTILKSIITSTNAIIEYNGSSGRPSRNYIKNISFIGVEDNDTHNHKNIGLHIKGKDDFIIDNCSFTNFDVCILLENISDRFTEYVIAENCLFNSYKNCMRLKRTGSQQSFHGCGLKECFVQENAYSEEVLYIGNGCQLYNGYLDFKIWINSTIKDSLVYLDGSTSYLVQSRELSVLGNIRYEGNIKKYLFDGVNVEKIVFNGSIYGLGDTLLSLTKLSNNLVVWSKFSGVKSDGSPMTVPKQKIIKTSTAKTGSITIKPFSEVYSIFHAVIRLNSSNVTLVYEMDLISLNNPQLLNISNKTTIQEFNQAGIDLSTISFTLDTNGFHINLGSDSERTWNATIVLTPIFYFDYAEYAI